MLPKIINSKGVKTKTNIINWSFKKKKKKLMTKIT